MRINIEDFKFWVKKAKIQSHDWSIMLENALFGLVNVTS